MNKYCRICWNTSNWREPTGEAQPLESPGSYVHEFGFGHEEWLFNFAWLTRHDNGELYKYAFLQPIGKYRKKYIGQTMDVALYTVAPDKARLLVARIDKLYVPDDDEVAGAVGVLKRKGWLDRMRRDLRDRSIDTRGLMKIEAPEYLLNVRFRRTDVHFFEPKRLVNRRHKLYLINRYQPVNWEGDLPAQATEKSPLVNTSDPRRSEALRTRAALEGTEYSPRHVQLQNALYRHLVQRYGRAAVDYEKAFVDLTLRIAQETIFFEIKMALTARRCVRDALGQLLDYGHYPKELKAHRFIVVGDQEADDDDAIYLKHLRRRYAMPVYYRQWSWEKKSLLEEI